MSKIKICDFYKNIENFTFSFLNNNIQYKDKLLTLVSVGEIDIKFIDKENKEKYVFPYDSEETIQIFASPKNIRFNSKVRNIIFNNSMKDNILISFNEIETVSVKLNEKFLPYQTYYIIEIYFKNKDVLNIELEIFANINIDKKLNIKKIENEILEYFQEKLYEKNFILILNK